MKKFNIKIVLSSLIVVLALCFGGLLIHQQPADANFCLALGYDAEYVAETDSEHLIEADLINYTSSLPISYDLRDYINIKVENQKSYGICYTFGTLTMLETYLAKKYNEYYDFSEIHMATAKYVENGTIVKDNYGNVLDNNVDFSNEGGGNFYNFYDYCMKNAGPVLEEEMPMSNFYSSSNMNSMEDYAENYYNTYKSSFSKIVTVNQFVAFKNAKYLTSSEKIANRNNIKQHIIDYGSCCASIYASTYGTHNSTQYLNSIDATSNHMISIIGWDDSYKPSTWDNAGAYLCLNSWGEDGYGGVFYVSYDDINIEESVYGITDAQLNTPNNTVSNYTGKVAKSVSYTVSSNSSIVATITDVSQHLNSYINQISVSVYCESTPAFYLGFINSENLISSNSSGNYVINSNIKSLAYPNNLLSVTELYQLSSHSYTHNGSTTSRVSGNNVCTVSLNSPVKITGKYAVLIVGTTGMFNIMGLELDYSSNPTLHTFWNNNLETVLSQDAGTNILMLTRFEISSDINNQTNVTGELINENATLFNQDNATCLNNTLHINIQSPTAIALNIEIYSISSTRSTLTKNYVTSNFSITTQSGKITLKLNNSISAENYILKFNIGSNTYYKSFAVISDEVLADTHSITYNLNGGTNSNYNSNTYSENGGSIIIYYPKKSGYDFTGWYLDSALTSQLAGTTGTNNYGSYLEYNNNLTVDLNIYAGWKLSCATITSQPQGITRTYSGNTYVLSCQATHPLATPTNNIKYLWYKNDVAIDTATSHSISVTNFKDSGEYKCKITFSNGEETSEIYTSLAMVDIRRATYDLSWNYTSAFSYDNTSKTVDIANQYDDLVYTLSNNSKSHAGIYYASVEFISFNENYYTPTLPDLKWEIKPATLSVKINDIHVKSVDEFNNFSNFTYSLIGTIYDDYDLNLDYYTTPADNEYIKLINANYVPNSNYNVTIIPGYLKVGKTTISTSIENTYITITNEFGYVTDVKLQVSKGKEQDLSTENQKFIQDKNLIVYDIYNISVTDPTIQSSNTISISIDKDLVDKNLQVYIVKDEELKLLSSSIQDDSITFVTEEFGSFIIAEAPQKTNMLPILISVGLILLAGLFCCLVVAQIKKHRNKKYYSNTDIIPH